MMNLPQKRRKLKPLSRFRRKADFTQTFCQKSYKGSRIELWIFHQARLKQSKLSIIVNRRVSTSAVQRNLWKRRIREILRKQQGQLISGLSIIVKVRAGQKGVARSEDLHQEILQLLEQAQALKQE